MTNRWLYDIMREEEKRTNIARFEELKKLGCEIQETVVLHDEENLGNKYEISYHGIIIGSELTDYNMILENIKYVEIYERRVG